MRDPNDFLSRLDETWLYHYDPETKQQSMEWRHSGSPRPTPKNSECKIPLENFSPRFFGIKMAFSSLFSKRPNYQRGVILISAGAGNWRTFWRKNARRGKVTKGVLFLHDNAPGHRAVATQKKLAYLGFQCLDHPPCSRMWPRRNTTYSLDWKNNWKVASFRPTSGSSLPRCPGWTGIFLNVFEWLAKVRTTDWEVYWALWGVCWINRVFCRCSLFPSWSG